MNHDRAGGGVKGAIVALSVLYSEANRRAFYETRAQNEMEAKFCWK